MRNHQDRVLSSRYTTWKTFTCDDWRDDGTYPPTSSQRQWPGATTIDLPVKQYAVATEGDVQHLLWLLPTEMYKPDGVDVYLGWLPGASWTSGDYNFYLQYLGKSWPDGTVGSGTVTSIYIDQTPADATTLREDKLGSMTVASTDDAIGMRIFTNVSGCSADDVMEVAYVRFQYTAWRGGTAMHPQQKP